MVCSNMQADLRVVDVSVDVHAGVGDLVRGYVRYVLYRGVGQDMP